MAAAAASAARADGLATAACTLPAEDAIGKRIVTIEGLGRDGPLHPVQRAFVDEDAMQCGACTPGMIAHPHQPAHLRRSGHRAQFVAMTSGRNAVPYWRIGATEVQFEVVPTAVRTGA